MRADRMSRLSVIRGPTGIGGISQFAGLSPYGRVVLARLERTRLWPGQAEEALRFWKLFVSDPYHRLWDPEYEGCRCWGCCTDLDEVRTVLEIVAHNLPKRDARRFRQVLGAVDEGW